MHNGINLHLALGDDTAEFLCVIKSLVDDYNTTNDHKITQDDLGIYAYIDTLEDEDYAHHIKKIRDIQVKMGIPKELAPENGKPYFIYELLASPDCDEDSGGSSRSSKRDGIGLTEFNLIGSNKKHKDITYWRWVGQREYYPLGTWLYIILRKDITRFEEVLAQIKAKPTKTIVPILPPGMLRKIYDNTIGFLKHGYEQRDLYRKYKIAYKRGILLCGQPGGGKTFTCRWLRELCKKEKLAYKIVSLESYQKALSRGNLKEIFELPDKKRGIIFFDDMDQAVKSRESGNNDVSYFLTALDGIDSKEGVVFVFTTNYIKELDTAFVRPGRIDVFLTFRKPSPRLREKFIIETFDEGIKSKISTTDLIEKTDDHSFAELEEIRKMLSLDLIDNKPINLEKTLEEFEKYRKDFADRATLGFKLEDDEDDNEDWEPWNLE